LLVVTPALLRAAETRAPLDVVFVLDNSGSMRKNDPAGLTRKAVVDFTGALARTAELRDRVAVVLFDARSRLVQPLTPVAEIAGDAGLETPLAILDFSGQRTDTPAGIERALYELRRNARPDAQRAIVLISDGRIDTGNAAGDREAGRWLREELATESRDEGVRIFGVAITEAADYQLMQALALRTDASYYRAFAAFDLPAVIDDVLAEMSRAEEPTVVPETTATTTDAIAANPPSLPDVAAAPETGEERFGPLGLLPIAALLVAASILWARRSRRSAGAAPTPPGASPFDVAELGAPAAELLDFGGQIGETGCTIALSGRRMAIGRDLHNDLAIPDDTISSEHALISVRDGRHWLEDRRSTNGTWLADEQLEPGRAVPLKGGDRIRFAEIELMYVLPGYVPGGATLFLDSSSHPSWPARPEPHTAVAEPPRRDPAPDVRAAEPIQEEAARDESLASEARPAEPIATAEPAQPELDLTPLPERTPEVTPEVTPESEDTLTAEATIPSEDREDDPYQRCLDDHLDCVEKLGPAFASFVDRSFTEELRDAISRTARELMDEAESSGTIARRPYTADRIRFSICAVATPMDAARQAYVDAFGGFTRMLTDELQDERFRDDGCEILAVLSFGLDEEPWVSLSIVPDEGQDPNIDLLSYELLTDDERREIEGATDVEISRSGLA